MFYYPGVYIFAKPGKFQELLSNKRASSGGSVPVSQSTDIPYIGHSSDIVARYKAHKGKKWFDPALELWTWYCPDESRRLIAETLMIFRLRPRHNRAVQVGLRLDGTLFDLFPGRR